MGWAPEGYYQVSELFTALLLPFMLGVVRGAGGESIRLLLLSISISRNWFRHNNR